MDWATLTASFDGQVDTICLQCEPYILCSEHKNDPKCIYIYNISVSYSYWTVIESFTHIYIRTYVLHVLCMYTLSIGAAW